MKAKQYFATLSLGLLLAAIPVMAHHPFAQEFDASKPVELTGMVMSVNWGNPHVHFMVSAKDSDGKMVTWTIEAANPETLSSRGFTNGALKTGDAITVRGFQAKDGSMRANARMVIFADGHGVATDSPGDGGPKPDSKG